MYEKILECPNELKILIYSFFVYIDIDVELLKVLFCLILIDTFLGVVKVFMLEEAFSFKKLILGLVSKIAVLLIPMSLALMGKGLNYDFNWFVTLVMDLLIVSDGISIFSNVIAIRTKKEVKNFDALTKLLKTVRSSLIKLFKRFLDTIDEKNNRM
ncbi:phage holin family protein [uncultured Dokdonia sp.]|uniref:phage holin family protein n=1 Tax=uncultured Dokdonia sp. TaxID=575653 RepID=UPI0026077250|nr:phage holin family protein [uncultured Dokdonia sp.]